MENGEHGCYSNQMPTSTGGSPSSTFTLLIRLWIEGPVKDAFQGHPLYGKIAIHSSFFKLLLMLQQREAKSYSYSPSTIQAGIAMNWIGDEAYRE